ncbi:MAG TPA: hypothetical protein VGP73_04940 [Thermoanaerobaculia bacterium]
MSLASAQQVTLKVHLEGAIAYAHDRSERLWALFPDALIPAPARWGKARKDIAFYARAAHIPIILARYSLIDKGTTSRSIGAVIQRYSNHVTADEASVVIPLLNQQLEFSLPEDPVTIAPEVHSYLPSMRLISGRHAMIARKFIPSPGQLVPEGLSAAFQLKGGDLEVFEFFGPKHSPHKLDFGYVFSCMGRLRYFGRKNFEKVANKLLWSVKLPLGQRSVKITGTIKDSTPITYVLDAPQDKNVIEIAIVHAEIEIPTLFRKDPIISRRVQRLPDPDFEMFYGISSFTSRWVPWRVPVPAPNVEGDGGIEKPCVGGFFGGFA